MSGRKISQALKWVKRKMIETNSRFAGPAEPEPSPADELKTGSTGKGAQPAVDEPIRFEPPASWPSWRLKAFNENKATRHDLQRQLNEVDAKLRVFTVTHMMVLGLQLQYTCGTISGRAALDAERNGLILRGRALLKQLQEANTEHADLKLGRTE